MKDNASSNLRLCRLERLTPYRGVRKNLTRTDNLTLSWPARLQDFLDRRCTLRAIDPNQPIDLSKPRNWILQDQRLAERQPVRTWPLDVLISRYGDDESQALLAQTKQAG